MAYLRQSCGLRCVGSGAKAGTQEFLQGRLPSRYQSALDLALI